MIRLTFRLMHCLFTLLILYSPVIADSREWVDSTGLYTVKATLIAYDTASVILKIDHKANPKSHDLLVIPLDKLSKQDQEYLSSKEAEEAMGAMQASQKWTMKNGMTVIGRVVDYVRRDVTIQRRRGKVYVNDKLLTNLPEIYQRFIPKIVEHFDKVELPNDKAFNDWMVKQKAEPRRFSCEGVILEFENHDEYAFPFFFFSDKDLAMLQSGWEKWLAHEEEHEQKERESFYLQAQAMEHQRNQKASQKMAMMQLELLAVGSGVTDLWEVYLEPGPRVRGYPLSVPVPARNSDQASSIALQKYPGYILGPVRKLSR